MDHLFVFCPVLCIMAVHFLLKGCRSWIRQKNTRGHAVKSEGLPKGNTYYVVGGEGVLICFITSCTTSHKKKQSWTMYIHSSCLQLVLQGLSFPGLQLTRHLTHRTRSTEGEAHTVITDGARDAVPFPDSCSHGKQGTTNHWQAAAFAVIWGHSTS